MNDTKKINIHTLAWITMAIGLICLLYAIMGCSRVTIRSEESLGMEPKYVHVFSTKCPEAKRLCGNTDAVLPRECDNIKIVIDANGADELTFSQLELRQILAGKTYQCRDYR